MRNSNLLRVVTIIVLIQVTVTVSAQELYVFTEPASNMPSRSISAKLTSRMQKGIHSGKFEQRYAPEIMFGLNKNWMVHAAASFSDMYSTGLRWEAVWLYAKYRFLSIDQVHRHFRMAGFAEYAHSRNRVFYDELSLQGDHSGIQAGIIATQLLNKLAVSSTISLLKVTSTKPKVFPDAYPYSSLNYSLSAGYLVLPVTYTDFNQTNLNLYVELLGQRTMDKPLYFTDLAPAVQLIFNSNSKLNIGYRLQLYSNMHRMSNKSWLVGFERTFLNAIRRKKNL
jgi:hypothetical protein